MPKLSDQAREARKAAVLRSTCPLLEERGVDATSTDDIAEEAGVSVGTLYKLFQSKEDLICDVFSKTTNTVLAAAQNSFDQDPARDPILTKDEIVAAARNFAATNQGPDLPRIMIMCLEMGLRNERVFRNFHSFQSALSRVFAENIRRFHSHRAGDDNFVEGSARHYTDLTIGEISLIAISDHGSRTA